MYATMYEDMSISCLYEVCVLEKSGISRMDVTVPNLMQ